MSAFVTGGPVPIDGQAYVRRAFEDEAFGYLTSSNASWVLMLAPRQHGKSTALRRIAERLDENGVRTAIVDLQAYGADEDYTHLLAWFAHSVAREIGNPPPDPPANLEDLEGWLTSALDGVTGSACVLIDEAAALPDPQRRRLWSQLRALLTARGGRGKPPVIAKIAFCFAGTFRPEKLIDGDNSPFNVSEDVVPTDLSIDEARQLAQAGGANAQDVVDSAYELVGGQPYLLQCLMSAADEAGAAYDSATVLEEFVRRMRSGADRHMTSLFERVLDDLDAQTTVAAMLASPQPIAFESLNDAHRWLQTLGVASVQDDKLTFRNRLYADFAAAAPQLAPQPPPPPSSAQPAPATAAAAPRADQSLLAVSPEAFDGVVDPGLRELAQQNVAGAIDAHRAGHHRLALAALGAGLEAVLLTHLESLDEPDRDAAGDAARAAHVGPGTLRCNGAPDNWTLQAMVAVAAKTPALSSVPARYVDGVRDWRNQIHPHLARESPHRQEDLEPEVLMSVGALTAVLRGLKAANPAPAPADGPTTV